MEVGQEQDALAILQRPRQLARDLAGQRERVVLAAPVVEKGAEAGGDRRDAFRDAARAEGGQVSRVCLDELRARAVLDRAAHPRIEDRDESRRGLVEAQVRERGDRLARAFDGLDLLEDDARSPGPEGGGGDADVPQEPELQGVALLRRLPPGGVDGGEGGGVVAGEEGVDAREQRGRGARAVAGVSGRPLGHPAHRRERVAHAVRVAHRALGHDRRAQHGHVEVGLQATGHRRRPAEDKERELEALLRGGDRRRGARQPERVEGGLLPVQREDVVERGLVEIRPLDGAVAGVALEHRVGAGPVHRTGEHVVARDLQPGHRLVDRRQTVAAMPDLFQQRGAQVEPAKRRPSQRRVQGRDRPSLCFGDLVGGDRHAGDQPALEIVAWAPAEELPGELAQEAGPFTRGKGVAHRVQLRRARSLGELSGDHAEDLGVPRRPMDDLHRRHRRGFVRRDFPEGSPELQRLGHGESLDRDGLRRCGEPGARPTWPVFRHRHDPDAAEPGLFQGGQQGAVPGLRDDVQAVRHKDGLQLAARPGDLAADLDRLHAAFPERAVQLPVSGPLPDPEREVEPDALDVRAVAGKSQPDRSLSPLAHLQRRAHNFRFPDPRRAVHPCGAACVKGVQDGESGLHPRDGCRDRRGERSELEGGREVDDAPQRALVQRGAQQGAAGHGRP